MLVIFVMTAAVLSTRFKIMSLVAWLTTSISSEEIQGAYMHNSDHCKRKGPRLNRTTSSPHSMFALLTQQSSQAHNGWISHSLLGSRP
jgi:hypothetical protein